MCNNTIWQPLIKIVLSKIVGQKNITIISKYSMCILSVTSHGAILLGRSVSQTSNKSQSRAISPLTNFDLLFLEIECVCYRYFFFLVKCVQSNHFEKSTLGHKTLSLNRIITCGVSRGQRVYVN